MQIELQMKTDKDRQRGHALIKILKQLSRYNIYIDTDNGIVTMLSLKYSNTCR